MTNGDLQALTDTELRILALLVEEELERRERAAYLAEDDERRRAAIRRGEGDPGPRR